VGSGIAHRFDCGMAGESGLFPEMPHIVHWKPTVARMPACASLGLRGITFLRPRAMSPHQSIARNRVAVKLGEVA
jgi:hypothetical protein